MKRGSGIGWRGSICICLQFHWEHPACLSSRGYLLSARQWLSVPERCQNCRRQNWPSSRGELTFPEMRQPPMPTLAVSLWLLCMALENLPKKRIFKKDTTLCISKENNCWPQMPHLLQVCWILFKAVCKSSLGTFLLNESGSPLSLFWPRWKKDSFFSLSLEAFLLSQTWPVKRGKGCAYSFHCWSAWNDDGRTRNPKKLS